MMRRCVRRYSPTIPQKVHEGLPRYPELSVTGGLRALDYIGTGAFASSGCLVAASCGLTATASIAIGCITALGGGFIRDVIFHKQFFLMEETEYLYIAFVCAAATSIAIFFTDTLWGATFDRYMWWLDTFGIAAFSVIGTFFGVRQQMGILFTLLCTVITCTGGGIIRDVLCRRPVRVLNTYQEAYAECTIMGGSAYLLLRSVGVPLQYRAFGAFCTTFASRYVATMLNIKVPRARDPPDHLKVPFV